MSLTINQHREKARIRQARWRAKQPKKPRKTDDLDVAFFRRVDIRGEDECWPWIGYIESNGYGRLTHALGARFQSNRLAYTFFVGLIPAGLFVCHRCDNRPCCNPSHLFLGTIRDNRADCVSKNRQARGERIGVSKLTQKDITEIRRLYVRGVAPYKSEFSCNGLAKRFGVDTALVHRIVLRKIWKHV